MGQNHVTETLAREVIEDKVAHAYLFSGPRGTGKTTSARLLAKSLNCPDRASDGEPCNACHSCDGITTGTSLDVIELDAASHNKVEDIREIRMNVGTVAAAEGARRVYILDEAHMLSRAASNALLKTLEEPPEHVIFVLATTEPYKLLDTIRSRTQRFDFHPIASDILAVHLATIADSEGFRHNRDALGAVAKHADGSVRDAMSLLEQVAALGAGEITSEGVARTLGVAQAESYGRLIDLIVAGNAAGGITLVAELAAQGANLRRFVADAIAYLRGIFLVQYTSNIDDVVDETQETIEDWRVRAANISSAEVLRAIDELSTALLQLREGREERLVVELAILRLTRPDLSPDVESLTVSLDRMERRIRELEKDSPDRTESTEHRTQKAMQPAVTVPEGELAPDRPFVSQAAVTQDPRSEIRNPKTDIQDPPSVSEPEGALTLQEVEQVWPAIVAQVRQDVGPRRHALLKEARPAAVEGRTAILEVASHMHFHLEQLRSDANIAESIAAAGASLLGGTLSVSFRSANAEPASVQKSEERAPDKDDLVTPSDDDSGDPERAVLDILGGEIVGD